MNTNTGKSMGIGQQVEKGMQEIIKFYCQIQNTTKSKT